MNSTYQAIENYLKVEGLNAALLLNGKWGTGKTYFIKSHCIDLFKKYNRNTTYLSLNGMKDIEEVAQGLIISSFLKNQKIKNKFNNIFNILKNIYPRSLQIRINDIRFKLPSISYLSILKATTSILFNKNEAIIILDDFERTVDQDLPKQILALVNNLFLEDKDYKVIFTR